MRYKISIPVFLAGLLVFALTVSARPENAAGKRNPRMRMMGIVLDKAGCPLDDAQIEQIKNLKRGPESREQFMSILTGEQNEALEEAHANRGDRGGRGHVRMMGIVLKNAGCPLDEAQKEQIKNLERGPDSHEQFMSILTGEQKEALENARKNAHRGKRRGPRIGKILEDAGYPLTEVQVEQIKNVNRGSDRKEQVELILTDEQKTALENHFTDRDREENVLQKSVAQDAQPETFNVLKQNYPNPFNPATTIDYQLAKAGNVTVEIYGPNGQLVSTLTNDFQNTGWHSVTWDASAHAGGIYVCKITSGDFTESRKMTYVK